MIDLSFSDDDDDGAAPARSGSRKRSPEKLEQPSKSAKKRAKAPPSAVQTLLWRLTKVAGIDSSFNTNAVSFAQCTSGQWVQALLCNYTWDIPVSTAQARYRRQ